MPNERPFVDVFLETLLQVCSTTDASRLALAEGAIRSVWDLVQKRAPEDVKKNSFFAGHGTRHFIALASNCQSFFKQNHASADSPYRQIECLVLLFASFLLHDIGMTIKSQDDEAKGIRFQEGSLEQTPRLHHDQRGLEFIVTHLSAAKAPAAWKV